MLTLQDVELDQRLEDNSDDDSCASDYGSQELKSFKKLTERETDDEIKSQGSNESWKDDLCNFLKNSANNDMENNNCGDDAGSGDMWVRFLLYIKRSNHFSF